MTLVSWLCHTWHHNLIYARFTGRLNPDFLCSKWYQVSASRQWAP